MSVYGEFLIKRHDQGDGAKDEKPRGFKFLPTIWGVRFHASVDFKIQPLYRSRNGNAGSGFSIYFLFFDT
jgi:hypothetical protein